MLQSHCRLLIPRRSPHQFMKIYETYRQLQCRPISDSQAFQSTQQSSIIHSDSFFALCQTESAKPKTEAST